MECRKIGIAVVIALLVLTGAALADEYTGHLEKKGSLAFKFGTHIYGKSDFLDEYDLSPDIPFYPMEIAYEHKIHRFLSLEFSVGYKKMDDTQTYGTGTTTPTYPTNARLALSNIYFSPTLKYFRALSNSTVFFCGIGPDIYDSRGKWELYTSQPKGFIGTVSKITWGAHANLGFDYFIFKNPSKLGYYDLPISIGAEYKYTYATVSDFDEDIVKRINADSNETARSAKDLDVGGHTFLIHLKWHFF